VEVLGRTTGDDEGDVRFLHALGVRYRDDTDA
jgi:hypothetical protein